MTISEVIKNITEIQQPTWAINLSPEDLSKVNSNFWLIWQKLKLVKEPEIIGALEKIGKSLTKITIENGKPKSKIENPGFLSFYNLCITYIPKRKYTFIYPKIRKKKNYDYEFLKLLAKDLKESIINCEDYYDTLEQLGILEKERKRLFSKYGISNSSELIEQIESMTISLIKTHPDYIGVENRFIKRKKEYMALKERIRKYGLLEPLIIDEKTNYVVCGNLRYLCCKELGLRKVEVIKKKFNSEITDIINFELNDSQQQKEKINTYQILKQNMKELGYGERRQIMNGLSLREYLFKETGISQSNGYKLEYIKNRNETLYNKVLSEEISIRKAYLTLKEGRK